MSAPASGFPGATAVSHLTVYDSTGPDGLAGGSPHLHTASTEGYVVVAGSGSLQTLSSEGFAETPLAPGVLLWFTPGTVHRLVNTGGLEIVVVMQNAGLPEAGDAVMTFPEHVLADPAAYAAAAALPSGEGQAEAAAARRDLAMEGFAVLRDAVLSSGPQALAPLHAAAAALVASRTSTWRALWEAGPAAQAARTGEHLADLAQARAPHLGQARVRTVEPDPGPLRFGMCGRLRTWDLSGALPPVVVLDRPTAG